uniref:Uncharacterized protein n=1 Tax=Chromera velia CCMP2878 TaxID=1169474 RepID=A0A0G4FU46_9ALVE|eukprot:Cvel_18792.t1-p1 / transcript=Cvel_18792.t1 / gene=Cvel_18792 / organism=Chromera_velia_CCMP2878 / gene_product=hypothetical protein / transcript_product=hypothetical protein / location=Cvel_scaffold1578:20257-24346(-) / protein_length=437 / sequence_SO=supercontig / SO=protein_coding / is_pseudo=false
MTTPVTSDPCFIEAGDCDCLGVPASSSNVLLLYHLGNLSRKSTANFVLACFCIIYIGINVVCTIINSMSGAFREENAHTFHLLEFWGTFVFTLVDVLALVYSPKSLGKIYRNPTALKLIVFFNVILAFIPAVLVSIDLETFELPSHEIEYTNEITMAFVDLIFLLSLLRRETVPDSKTSFFLGVAALLVAVVQLSVYNFIDGPGGELGERWAHYCEFIFEIMSASIVFWFCMDNKILCDQHIKMITHVPDAFTEPNAQAEFHEEGCPRYSAQEGDTRRQTWPNVLVAETPRQSQMDPGGMPPRNTYHPPALQPSLKPSSRPTSPTLAQASALDKAELRDFCDHSKMPFSRSVQPLLCSSDRTEQRVPTGVICSIRSVCCRSCCPHGPPRLPDVPSLSVHTPGVTPSPRTHLHRNSNLRQRGEDKQSPPSSGTLEGER